MRPAFLRFNVRALSVFLVVGFVMLIIASVFVLGIGQAELRNAWGEQLARVADHTSASVDAYIYRRIIDASVYAGLPDARTEAATASKVPFDLKSAKEIDRIWQGGQFPMSLKGVFSTPAAVFFGEVVRQNAIYREFLLTDRQGRLVAASETSTDYLQSDEEWWREAFGDGITGKLAVGDVAWDDSARVFALSIAVPVKDPNGPGLAGVLKVVTDIREVGAVIGGVRLGTTGEASLIREDGTFVFSMRPLDPNARFFATDLMRERLRVVSAGEPGRPIFYTARSSDGTPRVVGVAMSQLKASFPKLRWVVAVSEADRELFAPVRTQVAALLFLIFLTALAVLMFALWFSMRLAAHPIASDLHLVEHPPGPTEIGNVAA